MSNSSTFINLPQAKTAISAGGFIGTTFYNLVALLYFSHKYRDSCLILSTNQMTDILKKDEYIIGYVNNILSINQYFDINIFKTCTKKFIFCPITIGEYNQLTETSSGHGNMLIYNTITKELERFEPHGSKFYGAGITNKTWDALDIDIQSYFKNNNIEISKYYTPSDFCPLLGVQVLEERDVKEGDPGGFCQAWSTWYIELRLSNPDISRKDIMNIAIKKIEKSPKGFREYIRNYANFIADIGKELKSTLDPIIFGERFDFFSVSFSYTNKGIETIPKEITKLVHLKIIDISNNKLSSLPNEIGLLENLESLYVMNNKITMLPKSITNLAQLKTLSIGDNLLESFPDDIGKLSNLRKIDASFNRLKSLPESIGDLFFLTNLFIMYNNLRSLPESIGKLFNLTSLDISHNQLLTLPNSIGNIGHLIELNLENNRLTTLPDIIGKLTKLKQFIVESNCFNDKLFKNKNSKQILKIMKTRYNKMQKEPDLHKLTNNKIAEILNRSENKSILLLNLFNDDSMKERLLIPKGGILEIFYKSNKPVSKDDESYDKEITDFKLKCNKPSIFLKPREELEQTPEFNEITEWDNEKTDLHTYDDLNLIFRLDSLNKSKILDQLSFDQFKLDPDMFYTLPANTVLYRGVFANKPIHGNYTRQNKPGIIWLTPNIHEAVRYSMRLYGISEEKPRDNFRCEIYKCKTDEPLKLIIINKDNIETLKRDYPIITKLVDLIFPIKNGMLNRNSMMFQDYIFSYYLCNYMNVDGYFADKINRLNGEIMICKQKLTMEKLYIIKGSTVINWLKGMKVFDKKSIDYKIRMRSFLYFYSFNIDTSVFD
jgi:Leucine-rich repeat (LRR) protein